MSLGRIIRDKPSEDDVINNSKPGYLYSHDFPQGRFFQIVYHDASGFEVKVAAKTMLKAVYIKDKEDIEGIEFIKIVEGEEKQRIKLSNFNLSQIKSFLALLSEIDLKGITDNRILLADEHDLDERTIKIVKTLLYQEGGEQLIVNAIDDGLITTKDIVNTAYRKQQLNIFSRLLKEENYLNAYRVSQKIKSEQEEKIWQHFFQTNPWIFGYGLDYRFMSILQREFHASTSDADGSREVIADYLLGDKRFTVFVEIKKPTSPLFGTEHNRSNCWRLSNALMDGVSQILEQKASGQLKIEANTLYHNEGKILKQKAYDSKVILIIGHWNQLDNLSDEDKMIKERTFELFRRDSRNIEILTYDELYERAKYITENKN